MRLLVARGDERGSGWKSGLGLGFSPGCLHPIPVSASPSETPFGAAAPAGCESVVVVKIPEKLPRETRAMPRRMLSRVLSRHETSPFQSSSRTRALALPSELRNVLSAIRRHVVRFNVDRRLIVYIRQSFLSK
jgi:hypothetical protein